MRTRRTKERLKSILLDYLGDPEKPFPSRRTMSTKILGYKDNPALWKVFTKEELNDIEAEGLRIRRSRLAQQSAQVDQAVISKAKKGDSAMAKLYYQRFEGWSEKQEHMLSGGLKIEVINYADREQDSNSL